MPSSSSGPGPVALIADTESALAGAVATALKAQRFEIERIGPRQVTPPDKVAAVFLLERQSAVEALSGTIDRSVAPILVLAATRGLAEAALPLLNTRHDLALTTESAAIVAWRLRRLADRSRRASLGAHALDPLTGLLNRAAFDGQLRRVVASAVPGEVVGLLLLDLDKFKHVGDSAGHVAGDRTLQAVGELLPRCLPHGALVARLIADKFVCLIAGPDNDSIFRDVARVLQEISALKLSELLGQPSLPNLTASAGLTFLRPSVDAGQLMQEVEQAVYQAKSGGRNRLEIYGELASEAQRSSRDLRLQHFENVTRVDTERLVEAITLKSRRLIDAAKQEAYACPLTGLYSRRYFNEQVPREVARARSNDGLLSMALIDIDLFRVVNATHGWPTGDRVLQAFAKVVLACVRSSDWTARYGGEEFAILMPGATLESARQVAERVRQTFASTLIESVDGKLVPATLSAGVAQLHPDETDVESFVDRASTALRMAKDTGRNCVFSAG